MTLEEAERRLADAQASIAAHQKEITRMVHRQIEADSGRVRLASRFLTREPHFLRVVEMGANGEAAARTAIRVALQAADMLIEEALKP